MVAWRLMPEALPWGVGEPVRGSGWRVRVGVVVRGGVLERLLRGVPPMGDGNVGGVWGCSGKVTGGVGMRLTYCHRSCGCLLVADVGLGMLWEAYCWLREGKLPIGCCLLWA